MASRFKAPWDMFQSTMEGLQVADTAFFIALFTFTNGEQSIEEQTARLPARGRQVSRRDWRDLGNGRELF